MLDSLDSSERSETSSDAADHVVLLDERGRPSGTMVKTSVHHRATPLHLAFSCHVVRSDGRVLITRRSLAKRTWPGVWSNACCGHPRLGETLRQAVHRHVAAELGFRVGRVGVAIGDFAYRAEMADGVVEHELCPVVVAEVAGPMRLDPAEADGAEWVEWTALRERARDTPTTLSPWVVAQLARLPASPVDVLRILDDSGRGDAGLLDAPILVLIDWVCSRAWPRQRISRRPSSPTIPAVLTEQRGRVLLITLNQPDQMNSVNAALAAGLHDAIA